jgi:hypothetical protein
VRCQVTRSLLENKEMKGKLGTLLAKKNEKNPSS